MDIHRDAGPTTSGPGGQTVVEISPRTTARVPRDLPALKDPLVRSEPYGQDGGSIRTVAQGHGTAVILLGHDTHTLTVPAIAYAGSA
ncbi:hypothetical protein [Streptomyces sp. NPDC001933]|uniref:hypothetical protein n=1 Tax=Streptomyces sp. NPDC001933 TaxID=3364626 RepID=UPI0036BD38DB